MNATKAKQIAIDTFLQLEKKNFPLDYIISVIQEKTLGTVGRSAILKFIDDREKGRIAMEKYLQDQEEKEEKE
jgi:hypothetical protein